MFCVFYGNENEISDSLYTRLASTNELAAYYAY